MIAPLSIWSFASVSSKISDCDIMQKVKPKEMFIIDRIDKSKTFYSAKNPLKQDILYITLGYENYTLSRVRGDEGTVIGAKIWSAGNRKIVATINLRDKEFYAHTGEFQYIGNTDFRVVKPTIKDGKKSYDTLVKIQHQPNNKYRLEKLRNVSDYITDEFKKLSAFELEFPDEEPIEEVVQETVDAQQQLMKLAEAQGIDIDWEKVLNDASVTKIEQNVQTVIPSEVINMDSLGGDNVYYEIDEDGILSIQIDLKGRYGTSSSGKSDTIASTRGNVKLPSPYADVSVGLNIYIKKPE